MRIILWDVDGTLVDSAELHKEKIIALAGNPLESSSTLDPDLGVRVTDHDWDQDLYGKADRLVYDWIKQKNQNYPHDLKAFIDLCEDYFSRHVNRLTPRPGAKEAFNIFAAQGYPQVAVSSGTRQGIESSLRATGFLDHLVFTIAEGETAKSKPDPEPYNVAYSRMIATMANTGQRIPEKTACLVVEDSKGGAKAGGRSGIPTVFWKVTKEQEDSPFATHNLVGAEDMIALAKRMTGTAPSNIPTLKL
jgi:beta-phosphoglucomutase-like phosphatase (HAD superfamily)